MKPLADMLLAREEEFGPQYAHWPVSTKIEFLERRYFLLKRQMIAVELLADKQRHLLKAISCDHDATLAELQARNAEYDQINRELTQSRAQLERTVRQRTRELEAKNARLEEHAQELERINTTLDLLIKKNNSASKKVARNLIDQQRIVLDPLLNRLAALDLPPEQRALVQEIQAELQATTGFQINQTHKRESICSILTSKELEIARQVASGKNYNDISREMGLSRRSVEACGYAIRKKLNLPRQVNLKAFLAAVRPMGRE